MVDHLPCTMRHSTGIVCPAMTAQLVSRPPTPVTRSFANSLTSDTNDPRRPRAMAPLPSLTRAYDTRETV